MSASRLPVYAIEMVCLGLFMISAVLWTTAIEHPASVVRQAIQDPLTRRALVGLAMAVTAAALIYSPWGQRSGAHMNPAVTLTFLRLGKVMPRDAACYLLAQFMGGAGGLFVAVAASGRLAMDPAVNYVATRPGAAGVTVAFVAELAISFLLMLTVLVVSNTPRLARYTGLAAAALVALYITFEAPLSGMSMNPARSLAPAVAARTLDSLWIYVIAPPLGMLLAAEVYRRTRGDDAVRCAKLHHGPGACHFRCTARADPAGVLSAHLFSAGDRRASAEPNAGSWELEAGSWELERCPTTTT